MTGGVRFDEQVLQALLAASRCGDAELDGLLQRAVDRAVAVAGESGFGSGTDSNSTGPASGLSQAAERRLGDRILAALLLALDQDDLEVAECLERAFEAAMTRFGGPDAIELRDIPEGMELAYERLDALRHRRR